jgi:rubrerythrin
LDFRKPTVFNKLCINMTVAWIGVAVSVASAGYGAYSSNKASKAGKANNQKYFDAVAANEEEARMMFDGFMKGYNESAEKLEEGMTIEEYVNRMVTALNDPTLNDAYRKARNGDWEQAQQFADIANRNNISAFDMIVETVSGGDYKAMLERRNQAVLSEDADSLFAEAQRLRAPRQAAGSVVRDEEGEAVGGQRTDKFEFEISESVVREQNDRTFGKARVALEDDRAAAQRQQQRASDFLPFLDYSGFVSQGVVQPLNAGSLSAQLAQLQAQANLANTAMAGATGMPVAPPAGLASIYKSNQTTSAATGSGNTFASLSNAGSSNAAAYSGTIF